MSNALHDYAKLFEKYAANNGGTGAILAGEDCLSLANEMRMDADVIEAENAKLRDENAKLENVLHEIEKDAIVAYHCLQSDIRHVMESETEFFQKWWSAECRNDNRLKRIELLESENAKLRELLKAAYKCTNSGPSCLECRIVAGGCTLLSAMRELGVEL